MSNFVIAIFSIMYALVCLAEEPDQEKCSTSYSAEVNLKKKAKG
jgi:hypothetical protein